MAQMNQALARPKRATWLTVERRQALWGGIFALPAVVFFLGMYAYPLAYTFFLSLQHWDLISPPTWVGLDNYQFILQDSEFQNSVLVTLYYVFGVCVPIVLLGLLLAAFFNQNFRLRQLSLTVFYIPVVVSLTVWTILWALVLNPSYGLLTLVTDHLGLHYIRWLSDPNLAMPSLILLSIWKGLPYYTVILLAGMRAIPVDYYEAARVDGANARQTFLRITLPLLRPILLYVVVISVLVAFQVFTPSYLLTHGGPGSATRVLPLYIYETAFSDLRMGDAATASVIMFVMMLGITAIQLRLLRSDQR
jgi:multiple sugar transport system permease protein